MTGLYLSTSGKEEGHRCFYLAHAGASDGIEAGALRVGRSSIRISTIPELDIFYGT